MKRRIFVTACTMIFIFCTVLIIGYKVYSKDDLIEIAFKDEELKSENFILEDMYITNDENKSLGLYYQEDSDSNFNLYLFTKENDEYCVPKEITFSENINCSNFCVSPDESKIYMTIFNEDNSDAYFKGNIAYTDFSDLDDFKIDDLKYIDEINTTNNKIVSVDKNGALLYKSFKENQIYLKYAELKDNKYDVSNVNKEFVSDCYGAALSPDGQTMLISLPYDGENESINNIFVMKKEDESWNKPEILNTINDGYNDKVRVKISGDSKNLYFLDQTSVVLYRYDDREIETKIIKTDFNKTMKNFENYKNNKNNNSQDKKSEEKSRSYDTVQFKSDSRNKGDIENKKGIYYEIFVRAFADSNGDGIGDIKGVTEKLDYLKDLGVDGIYLMPINASPSYHGYDVIDYYTINKDYGTLDDFKNLLTEAHARDIKVIMDLVVNHTSNFNPWFTQSSINKQSKYRDYYRYVSIDDNENMNTNDKSPWGSDVWTKQRDSYYYSIFYSGMPDLNYNNKEVREEVKNIAKTYLEYGVDGFRLDGAMHIYGNHEFNKQNDDNLNNNIIWWNEFASFCEKVNPNVYLVGEVWNDDDIMPEYAKVFDTKFNFTFKDNLFEGINKGSAVVSGNKNLSEKFSDTAKELKDSDSNYIDGIFVDNHDLDRTMSIVKTEEQAKLIANIYLTLPGNPFIYYGEEIGMKGYGDDVFKRLPFKWNKDKTYPTTNWYELMSGEKTMIGDATVSLEEQVKDENSLYNHYKKIIAIRKNNSAFKDGIYESINCNNDSIMAYKLSNDKQNIYVIHNLSDSVQTVNIPEAENGEIQFASDNITNINKTKITLNKTSSIIITFNK